MVIFVTGLRGFVGRELGHQCRAAGHEVRGIDLPQIDVRYGGVFPSMPEGCVVVHLAALSTDALCEQNPLEALDVNVSGTINVARAALKRKCKQFIFASTEKVYGCMPQLQNETGMTELSTVYTHSKKMGERVSLLSGIPNVTVLRFGIAYGCRDTNWCAVEQIVSDVIRRKPTSVGHPDTARRYVHVRDLCGGILAAAGRTGHETFNLPGAELVTLKELFVRAVAAANPRLPCKLLSDGKAVPSVRNTDGTRAREVLGWVPKIPFSEGMNEVVEYLKGRKS